MRRRLDLVSPSGEVIPLDSAPFVAGEEVALSGMPRVSVSAQRAVGRGGSRVMSRRHDTRDLQLPLLVLADTASGLDEALARLGRAVDPMLGDVRVRWWRDDGTVREVEATYIDGLSGVPVQTSYAAEAEVRLVFEAHDPYWRDVNDSDLDLIATQFEGALPTRWDDPEVRWNDPIPWNGMYASGLRMFDLDMRGDVEAWPRWRIEGPATAVSLVNATTGQVINLIPTLVEGDVLEIDTAPLRRFVLLNDVNAWGHLSTDSDLWSLVPGVNKLSIRIREWEPGVTQVRMSYRQRYLTC